MKQDLTRGPNFACRLICSSDPLLAGANHYRPAFKNVIRKNLLCCNQREVPCLSDDVPKKLRKTREADTDFLGRIFSANSCWSQLKSQPKTVMSPVSHRKPVCGLPADQVASYPSEKLKRDAGAFMRRCREKRLYS